MRLKDRVAVVTGAQQGIGEAIAMAFAREGARLVVNYLDARESAEKIVSAIAETGTKALAVQADVAAAQDVERLIGAADQLGGVDLLVNNAGIFPRVDFLEMAESDWDRVLDVNLKGAYLCSQGAARVMAQRGVGGSIVNIASVVANVGVPLGVHYTASKGGLVGLTRACALALAPHRIRVNAIAPGVTDTAQPRMGMTEQEMADLAASLPLGEIMRPDDIADTAVFLASDQARQITGQTIHVNGGRILM